jgi:hypothetical protein
VVDGTGLENRRARKGTGGSNPSLSATLILNAIKALKGSATFLYTFFRPHVISQMEGFY